MKILLTAAMLCLAVTLEAQIPLTPLEASGCDTLTSHARMMAFVRQLDARSDLLAAETIGISAEGREIPVLYFSKGTFGADTSKIRVLIFAQQHGNEQSGKEGALLLASRLVSPAYDQLFEHLDLALVPQVNPDGAEADRRRNANGADLNRNHLVLDQPETRALHQLFDRHLFEVTMDVHEYYPYSESWLMKGYHKNAEVTVGALTNVNVSPAIRNYQYESFLPFLLDHLDKAGFSAFEYLPGGPPGDWMLRRSTFDINDGRQSLGSQHAVAFIQEGMNGRDSLDNMERRAAGQMAGMMGLLDFAYRHRNAIKQLVAAERKKLLHPYPEDLLAVQMAHVRTGELLLLPVHSTRTGNDSLVPVDDYRPQVEALESVSLPAGYLLPSSHRELADWVARLNLEASPYEHAAGDRIEEYRILRIDSIDFEGDTIPCPVVEVQNFDKTPGEGEYIFVPAAQRKGRMVVQALEPRSMLGLPTYPPFRDLVKADANYPVLRLADRRHTPAP